MQLAVCDDSHAPDCQLPTVELPTKKSRSVHPAVAALIVAVDKRALLHGFAGVAIPGIRRINFGEKIDRLLVAGVQYADVVAGVGVQRVWQVVEGVLVGHQVQRLRAVGRFVCEGKQQRLLPGMEKHGRVGSHQPEGDVIFLWVFLGRSHVGILLPGAAERLQAPELRAWLGHQRHLPRSDDEVVRWLDSVIWGGEHAPSEAVLQPLKFEFGQNRIIFKELRETT